MRTEQPRSAGRRRYLAALAGVVGFSGCLQFSEGGDTASPTRNGTRTPTPQTTAQSTAEADTESLPPGTRWTVDAEAPFVAGPVHVDGTVVATSVDRHVYGVDAATGDQQWAAGTETSLENGLTVVDGVTVAAGTEEQVGVGVSDGSKRYQHVDFEYGSRAQTAGDELVFQSGFLNGGVRAVRPATGEIAWSSEIDESESESSTSRPGIDHDGETVCVGINPEGRHGGPPWGFAGYDAASGEELWYHERDSDVDHANPSVVVSEGVCFGYSGWDHYMSIDARSGEVRTEVADSGVGTIYGAADGTVVLTNRAELQGVDVATGETRWRSDRTPAHDTLSFDGSTLWFVDDSDTLYRADVPSGDVREVQALELGDTSLTGDLAVTDETVFVTTEDATLRALDRT
ncbi:outer membrane protein assembly factor BamB family protein [Halorientalis salina]|uniref:outer membrane protein assembly factor BamB family protein n=1 Tax=Halorientalis salina TaxID=2932266 RepID=UPI0010ABA6BB|nr:PQQ-binding-like beta-propeller repeat protein [Halorientalis salina]